MNFQPYVKQALAAIQQVWLPLIPPEARPPVLITGQTVIRFTIDKDGKLTAMHLECSTHNDAINRAAWGSITGVGRFQSLPDAFTGPNLEIRLPFLVNTVPAHSDATDGVKQGKTPPK